MRGVLVFFGALCSLCVVGGAVAYVLTRSRRVFSTLTEEATYRVLHTANAAAPALRGGLSEASAARALPHLRALLATAAVAITDLDTALAWDGRCGPDRHVPMALAAPVVARGRSSVVSGLSCGDPACMIRAAVGVPILVGDTVVGTLMAFDSVVGPGLIQTATAVSRWVSTQLELAELSGARIRLAQSQLRALRAQISPHFVYNALTAIASFVRTDPDRARDLLVNFADFTRYSFRNHGEFTTLAEELRSVDAYLMLERARFGERLSVTVRIAPEVLGVAVPFLVLQPLAENAVRHGIEGRSGRGCLSVVADDAGAECLITLEDDGIGMDPDWLRRYMTDPSPQDHGIGMLNVDERLRKVFGPDYGLVIETGVGAGTKITVRVPKSRTGVRA